MQKTIAEMMNNSLPMGGVNRKRLVVTMVSLATGVIFPNTHVKIKLKTLEYFR